MANNLAIILCLLVGVGMLVFEALLPGFGLPGITGIVLLGVGSALVWIGYGISAGLCALLLALLLAGVAVYMSLRSATKGRLSRSKIILNGETQTPAQQPDPKGREGETLTVLNPVGMALIDGERKQVISEGAYIAKGMRVKVIGCRGTDWIVEII